MRSRYRFRHRLVVRAAAEDVRALLLDIESYPRWWPQVRAVARIDDDHALVVCRSALPYDLDLELTAISRDSRLLEVAITGPMDGYARWTLSESPAGTRLDYLQEVTVGGALAAASYLVKPVLRWNHEVMMRGFDRGVREVLR